MAKIQYENKEQLNVNETIPAKNKCMANDMNEIKNVVNENDDLVGDLSTLETTEKSSVVGALNELSKNMQKHMISATFTTDIEPTPQQYVELSNWNAIETVGNKLSIQNGKIVVGAGVSKIKIMGILGVYDKTNQLIYIYGRKNGVSIPIPWVVNPVLDYQSVIYNNLISVQEGDIISISVYGEETYTVEYKKSLFIFEVVE